MFKFFIQRREKGQSTLEYAILIIIVLAALLSIQVYIKRGIQGRFKSAADDIGEQFSPGNTNVIKTTGTRSQTRDTFTAGATKSQLTQVETQFENTTSNIIDVTQEFWGKTP